MKSILVTPPATEPVTLIELKRQCSVTHGEDDALLSLFLSAAREAVEKHTGLLLGAQEWDVYMTGSGEIPIMPVAEVLSVMAETAPGVVIATTFAHDPITDYLTIDPYPGALRYIARVNVGLAPEATPAALKTAILMLANTFYNDRETNITGLSVNANPSVIYILFPWRHNLGV